MRCMLHLSRLNCVIDVYMPTLSVGLCHMNSCVGVAKIFFVVENWYFSKLCDTLHVDVIISIRVDVIILLSTSL